MPRLKLIAAVWGTAAAAAFSALTLASSALASGTPPTARLAFAFGPSPDSMVPEGGLTRDATGRLLGAAYSGGRTGYGTIFRLSPPEVANGLWTEEILYTFSGVDGAAPNGSLALDAAGFIYGTTQNGGRYNLGTIFKLDPSSGELKTLRSFGASADDGATPNPALVFGPGGLLYGTTYLGGLNQGGTIFSIATSGSTNSYSILYAFMGGSTSGSNPRSGLVTFDTKSGTLGRFFGTTQNFYPYPGPGAVYSFRLDQNAHWREHIIYSFHASTTDIGYPSGQGGLVVGANSNLYVCGRGAGAYNQGGVAQLVPGASSGDPWVETLLYNFMVPDVSGTEGPCSVTLTPSGTILGTSGYGGTLPSQVFELTRPGAGTDAWTYTLIANLSGASYLGGGPDGPFVRIGGSYYGENTASPSNGGTVYQVKP